MAELDINYLNLVRNTLYSTDTTNKNKTSNFSKSNKSTNSKNKTDPTHSSDWNEKHSKKRPKIKHVTFSDKKEANSGCNKEPQSSETIKNRICTPYKASTAADGIVLIKPEKGSPSLSRNDSDSKKKGKKRRLSISDDTLEVVFKRKKDKPITAGLKLNFDDSLDSVVIPAKFDSKSKKKKNKKQKTKKFKDRLTNGALTLSPSNTSQSQLEFQAIDIHESLVPSLQSPDFEENIKVSTARIKSNESTEVIKHFATPVTKSKNIKDDLWHENYAEDFHIDSILTGKKVREELKNRKALKHLKKKKIEMIVSNNPSEIIQTNTVVSHDVDPADFYDNEKLVVKGLKFKKFCNLFSTTLNQQLQTSYDAFTIPKRHYNVSENDDVEWKIEVVNSRLGIIGDAEESQVTRNNNNKNSDSDSSKIEKNDNVKEQNNASMSEDEQIKRGDIIEVEKERNMSDNTKNKENDKITEMEEINVLREPILYSNPQDSLGEKHFDIFVRDTVLDCREDVEGMLQNPRHNSNPPRNDNAKGAPKIIHFKNGSKIVVLRHSNQTVHFYGLCILKVLNGEVEILGACLNSDSGQKNVYSPRGTSLLYIRNRNKLYFESKIELKNLVSEDLLNKNSVDLSFEEHCAIILCKELKEPYIDFIESHISQKIFPESTFVAQGPRLDFGLSGVWNKTRDSEVWEDILENVSRESKTVICGGKGVGKSTFLRYAVNILLRKFEKIRIIEMDPGQSEFYPPGCISVTTVEENVLGPNYTHLQSANRIILSHINMGYNVKQYLKSVKHLLESVEGMETLPTLVNFPGFTQGLGLDIAASTLKMLEPTDLIEIKSKTDSKNYTIDMTSENVENYVSTSKSFIPEYTQESNLLNYEYVVLNSLTDKSGAWSLEARQAREICVFSYFGKMMSEIAKDLTNPAVSMYSIKISALTIVNSEGNIISPLAINGSLVALCSILPRDSDVFVAHGYGFVRGMDLETDTLVLVTPEPLATLENVSHLVLSSVTTPPSLVMSATGVRGHIPYINVGELVDFGQFTKRQYLPPRK